MVYDKECACGCDSNYRSMFGYGQGQKAEDKKEEDNEVSSQGSQGKNTRKRAAEGREGQISTRRIQELIQEEKERINKIINNDHQAPQKRVPFTYPHSKSRRVSKLHRERTDNSSRQHQQFPIYCRAGFYTITKVEDPGQQSDGDGTPLD